MSDSSPEGGEDIFQPSSKRAGVERHILALQRTPRVPEPQKSPALLTWASGIWWGVTQNGCPAPTPSQAIGTLRGGVAPLGMNGRSDGFQKLQPSHKGLWERENPSSSPFSHIMADNLAIQWRVSR